MTLESKDKKIVFMIMIDALRHDYINTTDAPFLEQLAKNGSYGELQPSFGFEPDGAYFAGLHPDECDGGAQFWHNKNEVLFHYTKIFSLFDKISIKKWQQFLRKVIRAITQIKSSDTLTKKMATSAYIPIDLLKHFSTPLKKISSDIGFMPSASIFDILRKNNQKFYFHGFPEFKVHTDVVRKRYLEEENGNYKLDFLFFGDLDSKGHIYGPDSIERKNELKKIDNALLDIYQHAKNNYESVDFIIFGDHGMVETQLHINLTTVINKYFNGDDDDKYFLDSTLARFWINSQDKRNQIMETLNNIPGGHVISDKEKDRFHINYGHNYFGDIIFAADCGNLIHPSFYSDGTAPKGMHGYLEGCTDNESFFLISGDHVDKKGHVGKHDMRNIFPTILDLLQIDPTESNSDLKSILK